MSEPGCAAGPTSFSPLPSRLRRSSRGVCKVRRQGGRKRAASLSRWLDELVLFYESRILPFDAGAARLAGQMSDKAVAAGRHPGFPDIAIAAIAARHGLVILTRNARHFAGLGVAHLDPFAAD
jgi:toxin FitB